MKKCFVYLVFTCIFSIGIFAEINFQKHVIDEQLTKYSCIYSCDIDNDGDFDFIGSSIQNDKVVLKLNNGIIPVKFDEIKIADFPGVQYVYAGYVNSDEYIDVVATGFQFGEIMLYLNSGDPYGNWEPIEIASDFLHGHGIFVGDIDKDGHNDVVATSNQLHEIAWWKNPGDVTSEWVKDEIATGFTGTQSVYCVDIDGDDDLDVLGAAGDLDEIALWKNIGEDTVDWEYQEIDGNFDFAHWVYAADMNNDSYMDICGASFFDSQITWWKNLDGIGEDWAEKPVSSICTGAVTVHAEDLNDDGYKDLIGAAWAEYGAIHLWYNDANNQTYWEHQLLDSDFGGAWGIHAADFDGDGDNDIVAGADVLGGTMGTNAHLTWWENSLYTGAFEASILLGHADLAVDFTDLSHFENPITSWQWDFDNDGNIDSEEQNPSWTYTAAGVYTVTLIVTAGDLTKTIIYDDYITVFNGESALEFNGIDSKVNCTPDEEINLTETITIEAWVKPAGWGKMDRGNIINKKNFSIYLNKLSSGYPDSSYVFYMKDENDNINTYYTEAGTVRFGDWQHLGVSFDYSAEEAVKFYVNGIKQNLTEDISGTGKIKDNLDLNFVIGNNTYGTQSFNGVIDEVRLWDIVRSQGDILSTVNGLLTGEEEGLVGYWRMNEAGGESLTDFAGGNNTGTISNCPWVNGASFDVNSISDNEISLKLSARIYPNPFNPNVTISYDLAEDSVVKIEIFNALGQRIRNLSNSYENAGEAKEIVWDGKNDFGNNVSSGVYFYKISTSGNQATGRMLLVK